MKGYWWFVKKYVKNYWGRLIIIFLLGFIVGAIPVAIVQFVNLVLDKVFAEKDLFILKMIPAALIGLYIISGVSKYFHFVMQRGLGELIIAKVRDDLYRHVIKLPLSFYSKCHSGTMLTRFLNDVKQIPEGIMLSVDFVREPITFLGLLATAFYRDWKLTTMILTAAPIVIFLFSKVGATVKRYATRNLEQTAILGTSLHETFSGLKVIKAFNIEKMMKLRFFKINTILYGIILKTIKVEELSTPLVEFVGSLVTAVVIFIGGYRVIKGDLTQGDFMTILVALGLAQQPIKKLNNSNIKLQASIAAVGRIKDVFEQAIEILNKGVNFKNFNDKISFKNISFTYPGCEPEVLKNINMDIKKGEIVAIVGSSGSGKSTLVNLIPRFYEIEKGQLSIDGINVSEYNLKTLRKNVAVVTQDTFLFNDTILENIRAGKRTATEEEIITAAKNAYAYDFIMNFPDQFNTEVGERGLRLSGGEKQRIAIARAIIKNAPILILDEATSALDSESEIEVQKALDELMHGKTTLVIAHRLSTIKNADRIIVLSDGKIIEEGTHDDLLAANGAYLNFYIKQWGNEED